MICTNCKKEIGDNVKFCPECGVKIELQSEDNGVDENVLETDANQDEVTTEESLGTETDILGRPIPKKQKVVEQKDEPKEPSSKSRLGGALLALFFGWSGAHRFYLNNKKEFGLLQLFLSFTVSLFVWGIVWGNTQDFKPIYVFVCYAICGLCFFFWDFAFILAGKFKDKDGRRVTLWRPKNSCAITMYVLCVLIISSCSISYGIKKYKYEHSQEYFHKAIENGDVNVVKQLIEYGINVNQAEKIDKYGSDLSPIYRAVQKENIEIVKLLLNAGANANEVLSNAVHKGNFAIVKLLVEAGADVNKDTGLKPWADVKFYNVSLVFVASFNGNANIVKCLLENGASPNLKAKKYLFEKDETGSETEWLNGGIVKGNWVFKSDWTPLMIASAYNYVDVVKVLLDNDAELMTINNYGSTAIDLARSNNAPDALNVLLRYRRRIYGY